MKKTLIILVLIFTLFGCERNYIEDFKIEGITLGESLLNYMNEEQIIKSIEDQRWIYDHLEEKFGSVIMDNNDVEFYNNLKVYDKMGFFVKLKDKKYEIYAVRGIITYNKDINKCYQKQKEIVGDLETLFPNVEKIEITKKYKKDTSGKSTGRQVFFKFESGDSIRVNCAKFEGILNDLWDDGLDVSIIREEFINWIGID